MKAFEHFVEFVEFVGKITKDVAAAMPEAIIDVKSINKVNATYTELTIRPAESSVGQTINLNEFWKQSEEHSYENVLNDVLALAKKIDEFSNIVNKFENARDKIVMCVASSRANVEEILHETIEDLTIFYKIVQGEFATTISSQILENWGITVDQLHAAAAENMLLQKAVVSMAALIGETNGAPAFYVVTNENGHQGAATMLLPDVMEEVSSIMKGNFFILPSSVHEMLALQDTGQDVEALLNIVKDANSTVVAAEDKLTDSVYYYNAEEKRFCRVA